ncbi:MAG: flagellar biosynthesis protein FlhB [Terriglobia bacterium]
MGFLRSNDGRTEKASPKRRSEARQKGQVARSQAVPSALVFFGAVLLLNYSGAVILADLTDMLRRMLTMTVPTEFSQEKLGEIFFGCAWSVGRIVGMIALFAFLLGVGGNIAQGGLAFSTYRLGFHFENLSPANGVKRLLPGTSGAELLKNVTTLAIVSYLAYSLYRANISELPRYVLMSPLEIARSTGTILYRTAFRSGLFLLGIALVDYYWNRRRLENDLRMTKQEVKDEAKNAEGNPEVRSRIRRRQRQMAIRNLMAKVPQADVVITNPTHYAVALSYDPKIMGAPTVLAKGMGFVALKIKELATQHEVPQVENKPLAQSLYKAAEVGQQIPASLFRAVAEVLAFVYKLKKTRL